MKAKVSLYVGDCLEIAQGNALNREAPFQLIMFSTPYPRTLGFKTSVQNYVDYWLVKRIGALIPLLKQDTGVMVQNIWFPRREDGFYDSRIFQIVRMYEFMGLKLIEPYIWDKKNAPPAGNHEKYDRNQWEFVFAFATSPDYTYHKFRRPYADKTIGKANSGNMRKPDLSGRLAGGHSRLHPEGAAQGNILSYSSSGDQGRPRIKDRVYPRGLAERLILQFSDPGDNVLDPFCGSGTTLLMAAQNGRYDTGIVSNKKNMKDARER